MPQHVADYTSNANDNIDRAVKSIGRSAHRKLVFEKIYFGKQMVKSITELSAATGLSEKRVLEEGKKLVNAGVLKQVKSNGKTAYEKIPFFGHEKKTILKLVKDPAKAKQFPTKYNNSKATTTIQIKLPQLSNNQKAIRLSLEDIDNFSKSKKAKYNGSYIPIREEKIKRFLQEVLGEPGEFQDWGGEKNDLYTFQIKYKRRKIIGAFALKGLGTKGKLIPKKMGKNGDQIGRLFSSTADVFFVVYCGQIDDSIVQQMQAFANLISNNKSSPTYYCVIDGKDLQRLIIAYKKEFDKA